MIVIDLQTLSVMIAATGVTIAAIYYVLIVRNSQKMQQLQLETRQAQLYMGLLNTLRSPEFRKQWHITESATWKDFDDFHEKYSPGSEVLTATTSMFTFFDSVGTLVRKKLIDMDLVDGALAIHIIVMWKMYESILKGDREYFQTPTVWEDFEYIYNELNKRAQYARTSPPRF